MDRRTFLSTLTGGLLAAPVAAEAQSPIACIGLLGPAEEPRFSEIASGLKQGLREQGYRDDTFHVVEGRTRRGDEAGARATVLALAGQGVTVLFVVGSALVTLARETVRGFLLFSSRPAIQWRRGWWRASPVPAGT